MRPQAPSSSRHRSSRTWQRRPPNPPRPPPPSPQGFSRPREGRPPLQPSPRRLASWTIVPWLPSRRRASGTAPIILPPRHAPFPGAGTFAVCYRLRHDDPPPINGALAATDGWLAVGTRPLSVQSESPTPPAVVPAILARNTDAFASFEAAFSAVAVDAATDQYIRPKRVWEHRKRPSPTGHLPGPRSRLCHRQCVAD